MLEPNDAFETVTPTRDDILEALKSVDDPEMPISIVDLGMVERVEVERMGGSSGDALIRVEVLPTFVGCHALPMIEARIRQSLSTLGHVAEVDVRFVFKPAWSVDRISDAGREALRRYGVTVPTRASAEHVDACCGGESPSPVTLGLPEPSACPFCGSTDVRMESAFGPTRCRMIYYCESCRHSFEHLKKI